MLEHLDVEQDICVRPMTKTDYEEVVRTWMVKENWNPGKFDANIYFSGKDKHYYVIEKSGIIIAAILIYSYSPTISFLGAYVTEEQQRGRGYGKYLWNYAIKAVEAQYPRTTIGLYSVPAQIATYARSGFRQKGGTNRWEGYPNKADSQEDPSLGIVTRAYLKTIAEYDSSIFSGYRESFLAAMLDLPMSHFIFSHEHSRINGFALIRTCDKGYRIGPLYAKTFEVAKKLFFELVNWRPIDQLIFFDGNARNKYADALAEYFQFTHIPEISCAAMYKGEPPKEQNPEEEYAVMSLELR